MLEQTFLHVPRIGIKREAALWAAGFTDWSRFREDHPEGRFKDHVCRHLDVETACARLPRAHAWRLFPGLRGRVLFLDIETTGLSAERDDITCIGTYDGRRVRAFVQGRDIEAFGEVFDRAELLVTYNGACFDLPFLKAAFPRLDMYRPYHIDLRYPLRRMGFRGGLKGIEPQLGVRRDASLEGVDGFMAVRLWAEHLQGHPRALDTLVRYCLEDVVNLEPLMVETFNRLARLLPVEVAPLLHGVPPEIPWEADVALVRSLAGPYHSGSFRRVVDAWDDDGFTYPYPRTGWKTS